MTPQEQKIRDLERKLIDVEMERDILKICHFTTPSPNMAWVSDITYLKVGRKWHDLTVFIDLVSRKVVGWDLSASLKRYSIIRALHKAIMKRNPREDLLIHSDRGVQYASTDFRSILESRKFVQSTSWKTVLEERVG